MIHIYNIEVFKRSIQLRCYVKQFHIDFEWKLSSSYYKYEEGESGTSHSLDFSFTRDVNGSQRWEGDKELLNLLQHASQNSYFVELLKSSEKRVSHLNTHFKQEEIQFFETFDKEVSRDFDFTPEIEKEFPELVLVRVLGEDEYQKRINKSGFSTRFEDAMKVLKQTEELKTMPYSLLKYHKDYGVEVYVGKWRNSLWNIEEFSQYSKEELQKISEELQWFAVMTSVIEILRYYIPEYNITDDEIQERKEYCNLISSAKYNAIKVFYDAEEKEKKEKRAKKEELNSLLKSYRDQGMICVDLIRDKKNEGNYVGVWNKKIVILTPAPTSKEVEVEYGKFIKTQAVVRITANKEKVAFGEIIMFIKKHEGLSW